jgi:hypothetical protein
MYYAIIRSYLPVRLYHHMSFFKSWMIHSWVLHTRVFQKKRFARQTNNYFKFSARTTDRCDVCASRQRGLSDGPANQRTWIRSMTKDSEARNVPPTVRERSINPRMQEVGRDVRNAVGRIRTTRFLGAKCYSAANPSFSKQRANHARFSRNFRIGREFRMNLTNDIALEGTLATNRWL